LPAVRGLLREAGSTVSLIKPPFEAGREPVGKHGVVRDPAVHRMVLEQFLDHADEADFTVQDITFSPVRGPEGNIEYLGYLRKSDEADAAVDIAAVVAASHAELES
jgi:23S rRNA (cytidine1920-2'-O)/16S rRNA (cytidine1409-2'-O)-methyltransferase